MELKHDFENNLIPEFVQRELNRLDKIATWVSRLFSPPLMILLGLIIAALAINTPEAWQWAGFYTIMVVILPAVYIYWKMRRGEITDFHMNVREQRIKPLAVSLALTLGVWLMMLVQSAPQAFIIFGASGALQLAAIFLITLRWKISGHSATIASLAVVLVALFGLAMAPVLLTIPLVAWARVRLSRHEMMQTIGGALAGIVFTLLAIYLIYLSGWTVTF
ncbi:MAG: phosphatase PAP2 family protein [Anaerolineales bacterium]|nr:phosphatase PAP2 family protein [Anaerolineales bacterium]